MHINLIDTRFSTLDYNFKCYVLSSICKIRYINVCYLIVKTGAVLGGGRGDISVWGGVGPDQVEAISKVKFLLVMLRSTVRKLTSHQGRWGRFCRQGRQRCR